MVTDATRATAARDSVLQQATATRQLLEQRTAAFAVKARRRGIRRVVTWGYGPQQAVTATPTISNEGRLGKQAVLWKKVVVHRRSGLVLETFRGYLDKESVLKETRHNGQLTYLLVQRFKTVPYKSSPALAKRGQLTESGYVFWNNTMFLVPQGRGI